MINASDDVLGSDVCRRKRYAFGCPHALMQQHARQERDREGERRVGKADPSLRRRQIDGQIRQIGRRKSMVRGLRMKSDRRVHVQEVAQAKPEGVHGQ